MREGPGRPGAKGRASRILIADPDPGRRDAARWLLDRYGYDVVTCPGPAGGHSCQLLASGHCPLVDEAGGVVSHLGPDARQADLVRALRDLSPAPRLLVAAERASMRSFAHELSGLHLMPTPATAEEFVEHVRFVLRPVGIAVLSPEPDVRSRDRPRHQDLGPRRVTFAPD